MTSQYSTQNQLLLNKLLKFYNKDNNLSKILYIINGESKVSLRLIDWFTTNYAKKNFIVYSIDLKEGKKRFKVYVDYKLKLKAYSKRRFDPFCRWERINIPYDKDCQVQTTIGQLNGRMLEIQKIRRISLNQICSFSHKYYRLAPKNIYIFFFFALVFSIFLEYENTCTLKN